MDMFAADPLVEEKRVEEERFASAYLPGEIAEPVPEEAFAAEIFPEEEPPALPASPQGAVPVPPAGGAAAGLGTAVRRLAVHLASVVPRSWNRRHMLLAGAAVIAFGAAGISLSMWPGTPAPPPPQQAGAAGVRPMPLAPSAALARVPATPAEPSTRQKYAAQRQDQQLQQLLALRGGDAASAAVGAGSRGAERSRPAAVRLCRERARRQSRIVQCRPAGCRLCFAGGGGDARVSPRTIAAARRNPDRRSCFRWRFPCPTQAVCSAASRYAG